MSETEDHAGSGTHDSTNHGMGKTSPIPGNPRVILYPNRTIQGFTVGVLPVPTQ